MKKIAIVILHFGSKENTLECLESISNLETTIVVDNGSAERFKTGKLKVIKNEKNLGFAGGNNVGIKYALVDGADYILILNNDTLVDKNLILELLKMADSDPKIGIVVPKIYFAPGFEFHKDRYQEENLGKVIWYAGGIMDWENIIGHHRGVDEVDHHQYDKVEETEIATGCCMLLKKDVFEKVGLFDEKYFLYYEDADLSLRAIKAGFRIVYAPKAILWHKNAGSAEGSGSKLQDYYISRNRLLFGMRWAPFRSKLALLKESIGLFINGRPWQRRGALDFYLGRFGKGSYSI